MIEGKKTWNFFKPQINVIRHVFEPDGFEKKEGN